MNQAVPTGRKMRSSEAAIYLGISNSTLAKWRHYGVGPRYSLGQLGGVVLYDVSDLDVFVAEHRRISTSGS
jgi:hypothetical protein